MIITTFPERSGISSTEKRFEYGFILRGDSGGSESQVKDKEVQFEGKYPKHSDETAGRYIWQLTLFVAHAHRAPACDGLYGVCGLK